jgi:hypothetical protein
VRRWSLRDGAGSRGQGGHVLAGYGLASAAVLHAAFDATVRLHAGGRPVAVAVVAAVATALLIGNPTDVVANP